MIRNVRFIGLDVHPQTIAVAPDLAIKVAACLNLGSQNGIVDGHRRIKGHFGGASSMGRQAHGADDRQAAHRLAVNLIDAVDCRDPGVSCQRAAALWHGRAIGAGYAEDH